MIYNQSIKDFKPNSIAYLVYRERPYGDNYVVKKTTVESVGRKYVTLQYSKYKYLQEKSGAFVRSEYINGEQLFCSEVLAQICVKRMKTIQKIYDLSYIYNYDVLPFEDLERLVSIYESGLSNME